MNKQTLDIFGILPIKIRILTTDAQSDTLDLKNMFLNKNVSQNSASYMTTFDFSFLASIKQTCPREDCNFLMNFSIRDTWTRAKPS